jgi:uncharacterized membrane protein YeaQ/YmgE (transglycosylase-associated protein family)
VGIIAWLIFGAIAGWIATSLYGERKQGCIGNIVIGVVGAWIGGFIGNQVLDHDAIEFNISSMIIAVVGSLILLFVLNLLAPKD